MEPTDIAAALADVARAGPFFVVRTEHPELVESAWRPLAGLYADAEPLRQRVAEVGRVSDTNEPRVAASLAFQSAAARIVSAPLALLAWHGVVLDLDPARCYWRPDAGGPWPLLALDPSGHHGDDAGQAAATLAATLSERHLRPLAATIRRVAAVAEPLLWGNAASSVAAALRVIGQQRPDRSPVAVVIARTVLSMPPLADSWSGALPAGFRRRSCCLYYRTPQGGLCGDCGLDLIPAPNR